MEFLTKMFRRLFGHHPGMERLLVFILTFFFMCHLCSCFWIIIPSMYYTKETKFEGTWLSSFVPDPYTNHFQIYVVSFYWTITTITTVGYGDISGTNNPERIFCCIVMVIGVIAFGFANGTLASIMTNYDNKSGKY